MCKPLFLFGERGSFYTINFEYLYAVGLLIVTAQ